jgi:class 3 adenylate cyclase
LTAHRSAGTVLGVAPIGYAKHGEVSIAYQVVGHGPVDVLMVPGFISHLDLFWTSPEIAAMYRRLGSFSRFITFDKPGTGVSDPIAHVATLEERMEDVHAVLDAVGSQRAALFGFSEGGPMSVLFAATYPERVSALALYGTFPSKDFGLGFATFEYAERVRSVTAKAEQWGDGVSLELIMPRLADSAVLRQGQGLLERASASPAMARGLLAAAVQMDVSDILPTIRVPTVVIHRTDDALVPVAAARWMAGQIPGARFVELPGDIHTPWFGDMDAIIDEVEELVTGVRRGHEPDRALATVLFTDIVDSTRRAAQLGDRAWRELLERHDALAREELARYRGRYVKSTGDGMLATFDGPARAIRCAQALAAAAAEQLNVTLRAGVHTGECELIGEDVGGLAVHIGARVAHLAGAGEVLVSSTVKDLVVGSGLDFADRGEHELKGVPGRWRVFAVAAPADGADPLVARRDPALAQRADEMLSIADRTQLRMARRAPWVSRAAARLLMRGVRQRIDDLRG